MGPACINPERDIYAIPSRPSPTNQFRQEAIHIHFAGQPLARFYGQFGRKIRLLGKKNSGSFTSLGQKNNNLLSQ
jgi:hypothetical protein